MRLFPNPERYARVEPQDKPVVGHRIVFGLDWGNHMDRMGVAIMDATTHQLVALDRTIGEGYAVQRDRVSALHKIWKPQLIYVEAASIGGPNIEALRSEGLPVYPLRMTRASRADMLNNLALELNMGRLRIVPDEGLINELSGYEYRAGGQGDFLPVRNTETVVATALALHGTRHGGLSIRFA